MMHGTMNIKYIGTIFHSKAVHDSFSFTASSLKLLRVRCT